MIQVFPGSIVLCDEMPCLVLECPEGRDVVLRTHEREYIRAPLGNLSLAKVYYHGGEWHTDGPDGFLNMSGRINHAAWEPVIGWSDTPWQVLVQFRSWRSYIQLPSRGFETFKEARAQLEDTYKRVAAMEGHKI